MKKYLGRLSVCLVLLASSPANAQQVEVVPLTAIGFTLATDIKRTAPEIDELRIKTGTTWGGQVGYFFSTHWGADALFTRQETALEVGTSAGRADLFSMKAAKLHGNLVYQFGSSDARVRPFLFAGLGTTFFSARDLKSETKLSSGFGGGLKYFPLSDMGIRLHLRATPTWLDDDANDNFCDPFGFCQGSLQQIEVMAALVLRY